MNDILIVEDAEQYRILYEKFFTSAGYKIASVATVEEANQILNTSGFRIVCMNYKIKEEGAGRSLLHRLKVEMPNLPVILVTGILSGTIERTKEYIDNIKKRNPNLKEVILKSNMLEPPDTFYESLLDSIERYILPEEFTLSPPFSSNQSIVSWLHISDLHIGHNKRDWAALKNALLEDIELHQQPVHLQKDHAAKVALKPDILFITGDVAYQAGREEYLEAANLVRNIWSITGISRRTTFFVPGNHDVRRSTLIDNMIFQSAYNNLADRKLPENEWYKALVAWWNTKELRNLWYLKFEDYLKFQAEFSEVSSLLGYYSHSMPIRDMVVNIMGFNSALMSWKDGEDFERGLWIGKPQFEEVNAPLTKDANVQFALVHHPLEAMVYHEKATWRQIESCCSFLLHGHLHEANAYQLVRPGVGHVCIPGGSIHQNGIWERQHYSYGCFNCLSKQLDVYLRMTHAGQYPIYTRDSFTFPQHAPQGHARFQLS